MMKNWTLLMMLLLTLALLGTGCQMTKLNGVEQLTNHPQFQKAAVAAPNFTKAALKKVAELEYEIERR